MRKVTWVVGVVIPLGLLALVVWHFSATAPGLEVLSSGNSPQIATTDTATHVDFHNLGAAPNLTGITTWLNGPAPDLGSLRDHVVLVEFWTYSSVSSLYTLPHLNQWNNQYHDQGLVVIGIHTPEFSFERVKDNVQTAVQRFGVNFPVGLDNQYATWNAFHSQFWPTQYLIDKNGTIVYSNVGEGHYDVTEQAIKQLLGVPTDTGVKYGKDVQLPLGSDHVTIISSKEKPNSQEQVYTLPKTLKPNSVALEGIWKFNPDNAVLTQGYGRIRLRCNAQRITLTAASIKPVSLALKLDGNNLIDSPVQAAQNYVLYNSDVVAEHILEITIPQPGFTAYNFTCSS